MLVKCTSGADTMKGRIRMQNNVDKLRNRNVKLAVTQIAKAKYYQRLGAIHKCKMGNNKKAVFCGKESA